MSKNQTTDATTDEPKALEFIEDCERQIILVSTPKRRQKIKIFVPVGGRTLWRILYEDGNFIPCLSNGSYISRSAAIRAVIQWEMDTKKTVDAKQYELFGDKEPPVLKRKKIRGARV